MSTVSEVAKGTAGAMHRQRGGGRGFGGAADSLLVIPEQSYKPVLSVRDERNHGPVEPAY